MLRLGLGSLLIAALLGVLAWTGVVKIERRPGRQWGYHSRMTTYRQSADGTGELDVIRNEEAHFGAEQMSYVVGAVAIVAGLALVGNKLLNKLSDRHRRTDTEAKAKQDENLALLDNAFR